MKAFSEVVAEGESRGQLALLLASARVLAFSEDSPWWQETARSQRQFLRASDDSSLAKSQTHKCGQVGLFLGLGEQNAPVC